MVDITHALARCVDGIAETNFGDLIPLGVAAWPDGLMAPMPLGHARVPKARAR
jgi:hypothetical protein